MRLVYKDDLLIVSTGYLARDVFHLADRAGNFYMIGSMGSAYAIGLGLAVSSKQRVVVISGDGAALMDLGSLVLGTYLHPKNLFHYVVDNGKYASTGGQPTCSIAMDFSQFYQTIHFHVDKDEPAYPRIPLTPQQIKKRFMKQVKDAR